MKRNYILIPIGSGGKKIELSPLTVTENGDYVAEEGKGYNEVSVSVPDIPAVTEPLNVTENGTYSVPEGVDGYNTVSVNVPTTDVSVVSKLNSVTILGYTSLQADIYVGSNKTISSCGVEVSTDVNFSEITTFTSASNTNGDKQIQITGLTPNTTYYIRSFVIVNGVNYNQEPFNTSTTIATPAMPESIPATATKMVTANTDVVNLKFKNNSPNEVVYIDWGDGAVNGSQIAASTAFGSSGTIVSHTYSETGVYDVYIWSKSSTDTTYGKMPAFYQGTSGNDMKIARIETPLQNVYSGSTKITANTQNALSHAFAGCASLEYVCPTLLENIHYYKNGVNKTYNHCYQYMFYGCTSLTTAPELPATTLADYCYQSMFFGCTSLITAPELPATTLAKYCYQYMFNGCTSLTTAPELPAITLKDDCYYGMFQGCTSLTTAPDLPATTLADYCYQSMFFGCTSLTTAPDLPATTLADSCYYGMFQNCTSLTTAPILPATTLADYCYQYMFFGCTSLTTAPVLPATTLASYCYYYMFNGCTSLITAPELPATTLADSCYYGMFQNCTSLTTAPELPATTLASSCYNSMFYGCTNLQSVTTYIKTWNTSNATSWLSGAGTNVENPTLYCPANSTIKDYTNNNAGIPTGWTQVDLTE